VTVDCEQQQKIVVIHCVLKSYMKQENVTFWHESSGQMNTLLITCHVF